MLPKEDYLKRNKVYIEEAYNKTSVLGTPSEIWTREEFDHSSYLIYAATQKDSKHIIATKQTPTLYWTGKPSNQDPIEFTLNKLEAKIFNNFYEANNAIRELKNDFLRIDFL